MTTLLLLLLVFILSTVTVYIVAVFMKESSTTKPSMITTSTVTSNKAPIVTSQTVPDTNQNIQTTTMLVDNPQQPSVPTPTPMCCQHIDNANTFLKSCTKTCDQFGQMPCFGQMKESCDNNVSSCIFTSNGCVAKPGAPKSFMKSVDMSVCDADPKKTQDCPIPK